MCKNINTNMKAIKKDKVVIPSKIVIRRLPPDFTEEELKNVITPIPENDYFKFVPADKEMGSHGFSRAYINFTNPNDIYSFRDTFDGYIFVDQKGNEYCASVEYAPFQKYPTGSSSRKDARCATIDEDPDYVSFLEKLRSEAEQNAPQIEAILEQIETSEREARENAHKKVKTPLLDYIEHRNAERARAGERRRKKELEKRRAREEERRMRKEARASRRMEEKSRKKEESGDTAAKSRPEDRNRTKSCGSKDSVPENGASEQRETKTSPRECAVKTKRYSEARRKEEKPEVASKSTGSITKDADPPVAVQPSLSSANVNSVVEDKEEEKASAEDCPSLSAEAKFKERVTKSSPANAGPPAEFGLNSTSGDGVEPESRPKTPLEGENGASKDSADLSKKDPRSDRKIRNKDRPDMQIYRPGQNKLRERAKPADEQNASKSKAS